MAHPHHSIDYVELNVTDLARARAFYADAFGWEFNDYGPEYAGIRSADGDGEAGGLNATGGASPGGQGPLVLVVSDDLDASLEAVTSAGGTVVVAPFAYPGGRRFQFTDPDGNQLGVFTPAE